MKFRNIFFISTILMSVLGASIGGKSSSSVDNNKDVDAGNDNDKNPFEKQNTYLKAYKVDTSNTVLNVSDNVLRNIQAQQSLQEAAMLQQQQVKKQDELRLKSLNSVQGAVMRNTMQQNRQQPAVNADYKTLFSQYYSGGQLQCLIKLVQRESGGRVNAVNKSSGAWGLFQALPATKMASYGGDWKYNANTQTRWGINYIKNRYSTPCGAWSHEMSHGWY